MRKDKEIPGNGAVSIQISDTNIPVGSRYVMTVVYTAGKQGVSVGGSLRFKLPGLRLREGMSGFNLEGRHIGPVSCSNPRTKLRCSNSVPRVNDKSGIEFFTIDYLFVMVEAEPLREGAKKLIKEKYRILQKILDNIQF